MKDIVSVKEFLVQPELLNILSECIYMPTAERLNTRARKYMSDDDTRVFGMRIDNNYGGIIVLDCSVENEIVIKDIAVSKNMQRKGIGSSLIDYVVDTFSPKIIRAETDDEAVDFYKRYGFIVKSLGEKYPGIVRYDCRYYNKKINIETRRLVLREYTISDIDNFYKLKSCKEVWNYSTFIPTTEREQVFQLLEKLIDDKNSGQNTFMALFLKATGEYIGEAGIISSNPNANRCVIGYNLLPEFWNQGFATEITKGIIKYAFDKLEYERIEALVVEVNKASCKVLEKSGFLCEGVLRNYNRCETGYRNVNFYGIISSDYYKRHL